MAAPITIKRSAFPLSLALALAAVASAAYQDPDPEPPGKSGEEQATPAVDLTKADTDPKLAQQVRANTNKSTNNLKQFGLAFHNYHDAHGAFPDDYLDKKGKPALSWRVKLLPYLEQDKLYKEFKLDEPWDSAHNKKLAEKMPDIFRSPRVKVKGKGHTVYQVFKGPNAVFGRGMPLRLTAITDGTSNTIMATEATTAVPWTKPADVPFDRAKALLEFGKAFGNKPLVVMCDGSVRTADLKKTSAATLKNLIDPMDGNVIGGDW